MVNKCCVPGCKTGYKLKSCEDSKVKNPRAISRHIFPADVDLKRKWIRAIPRSTENQEPTKNSRVCGLHFLEEDFILYSQDDDMLKKEGLESKSLERRRLKDNAIPSVFPNLPSYLTQEKAKERSSTTSSSSRFERECR